MGLDQSGATKGEPRANERTEPRHSANATDESKETRWGSEQPRLAPLPCPEKEQVAGAVCDHVQGVVRDELQDRLPDDLQERLQDRGMPDRVQGLVPNGKLQGPPVQVWRTQGLAVVPPGRSDAADGGGCARISASTTERVHFFSVRGRHFAYDVATTACVEVDSLALTVLPEMLAGPGAGLEEKYAHAYPKRQLGACIRQCERLLADDGFGGPPTRYRHAITKEVQGVCLHVAHCCNLRCAYCYADAGSFGRERQIMTRPVMIRAMDFAFEASGSANALDFGFFGGEPLLNAALIREAVTYAKAEAIRRGKRVTFSMTSNATLLTPSIMEFLHTEQFSLIFSIDGPRATHDRMRQTRSGHGSHARVLRHLKQFARRYSGDFTVRGTFTRTTPNFADQVVFLNDQGFQNVSVEPAQLHPSNPHAIYSEADLLRVQAEYARLTDIYVERLLQGSPLRFFHFDYVLRKLLAPAPMHTQCGAGGGYIAITPDGKIFPCFEAVVEEENCIGDIENGFDDAKRLRFQRLHADVRTGCRPCWLRYFCGGGCHALNIRYNGNIHTPYAPYCRLMKLRFELCAWILAEIMNRRHDGVERVRRHVGLNGIEASDG